MDSEMSKSTIEECMKIETCSLCLCSNEYKNCFNCTCLICPKCNGCSEYVNKLSADTKIEKMNGVVKELEGRFAVTVSQNENITQELLNTKEQSQELKNNLEDKQNKLKQDEDALAKNSIIELKLEDSEKANSAQKTEIITLNERIHFLENSIITTKLDLKLAVSNDEKVEVNAELLKIQDLKTSLESNNLILKNQLESEQQTIKDLNLKIQNTEDCLNSTNLETHRLKAECMNKVTKLEENNYQLEKQLNEANIKIEEQSKILKNQKQEALENTNLKNQISSLNLKIKDLDSQLLYSETGKANYKSNLANLQERKIVVEKQLNEEMISLQLKNDKLKEQIEKLKMDNLSLYDENHKKNDLSLKQNNENTLLKNKNENLLEIIQSYLLKYELQIQENELLKSKIITREQELNSEILKLCNSFNYKQETEATLKRENSIIMEKLLAKVNELEIMCSKNNNLENLLKNVEKEKNTFMNDLKNLHNNKCKKELELKEEIVSLTNSLIVQKEENKNMKKTFEKRAAEYENEISIYYKFLNCK